MQAHDPCAREVLHACQCTYMHVDTIQPLHQMTEHAWARCTNRRAWQHLHNANAIRRMQLMLALASGSDQPIIPVSHLAFGPGGLASMPPMKAAV